MPVQIPSQNKESYGKRTRTARKDRSEGRPLTQNQEIFDQLAGDPPLHRRSRWESTVGAGLPIISSLTRMESCGDRVKSVQGTLSSTLGYLMTGIQHDRPFSELMEEMGAQGYTEPDPREDLSGRDVARKALILARSLGWKLELEDVELERLYPAEMDSLSLDQFLRQLPRLDKEFAARAGRARRAAEVLRYILTVEMGTCRVALTQAPLDSPLGRLHGTSQLVEIRSRWYSPEPLVIQGRGAGVDATAAAVLSDILELAFAFER